MKKLVIIGLLVVGGLYICNKTRVGSYLAALVSRGEEALDRAGPRGLRIDTVRREIDKLDAEFRAQLGPVAAKKNALNELERKLKTDRARLEGQQAQILELARLVKSGSRTVTLTDGSELTLDEAKTRLAAAERAIAQLEQQEKRLAVQRDSLRAAEEKLQKSAAVITALEERLDRVRDAEDTLALSRLSTSVRDNRGRVASVTRTLEKIETEQNVEHIERDMYDRLRPQAPSARTTPAPVPTPDLGRIETFFGATAPKVAQQSN